MKVFGTGPTPFQNFPFIKDRARGWELWRRGGDIFSPSGWNTLRPGGDPKGGKWFNYLPDHVRREWHAVADLPFFTCRWGRFGFYCGYKAFGADSAAYLDFPTVRPEDIFYGSVALTGFTARITTKLEIPL
jgi:hypothetical protein